MSFLRSLHVLRIPELVERAQRLKVGSGFDPDTDIGPLITPEVISLNCSMSEELPIYLYQI
jgi:hypothetical protein